MKFTITTACEGEYKEVLKAYPKLKDYKIGNGKISKEDGEVVYEIMKIEINSLEELIKLGNELGKRLIIETEFKDIMIYDYYIE